jgi:hypothetical protein
MTHDVFVSYSKHDAAVAQAVCAAIERASLRVWIAPRDVPPGAKWAQAIPAAIEGARVVVLVFSRSVNASEYISRELVCAVDLGLPIVTLRIENVDPSKDVKFLIQSSQWLDAFPGPIDRHLPKLVDTLRNFDRSRKQARPATRQTALARFVAASNSGAEPGAAPPFMRYALWGIPVIAALGLAVKIFGDGPAPAPQAPPQTLLDIPITKPFELPTHFACGPNGPRRVSQFNMHEISGFARVATMNTLEVGGYTIELADVAAAPRGGPNDKLRRWIEDNGPSVRCRPVAGTTKYCCDVSQSHLDISAQILSQGWARADTGAQSSGAKN